MIAATSRMPTTSVCAADVEGPVPRRSDAAKTVFRSRTDAAGCHQLRIDFASGAGTYPVRIDATATVSDRRRKAASHSAHLLVHADRYVGLRTTDNFVQLGEQLVVEVAVVDQDGDLVAGHRAVLRAARLEWEHQGGEWQEAEQGVQQMLVQPLPHLSVRTAQPAERLPPSSSSVIVR